jgi:hypothetical protein
LHIGFQTNESQPIQKEKTMDGELLKSIITGMITGAFSAGSIWGIMSTRLAFLQRDIERAHMRLDKHEDRYHLPDDGRK